MDQQFYHVILTRFNLCSSSNRESKLRNTKGWLEERFQLFEKYCLPSVLGQTNQNFHWYIFFDIDTPVSYKERALAYTQQNKNIKLFWVKALPSRAIHDYIRENDYAKSQLLITTRLDNDDALNKNFIAKTQELALGRQKTKEPFVINFDNGLCLNNARAYQHRDVLNAFTSLVEPFLSDINTVWKYQHRQLNHFKVVNLQDSFMWLQVIHNLNVSNCVRGLRINNRMLKQNFNLEYVDEKLNKDNQSLIFLENVFFYPVRLTKELCRIIYKSSLQRVIKRYS